MNEPREMPGRRMAPFVVFGGIFAIAIGGLIVIFQGYCSRNDGYQNEMSPEPAEEIAPGVFAPPKR